MTSSVKYSLPTSPVNDLADDKTDEASKAKIKLASLFRLIETKGYTHHIYNYASLRCAKEPTQFFTNPVGLLFSEVSASKLIKVDSSGRIVDHGSTKLGYSSAAYGMQSAIYKARDDINCIVHLNEPLLTSIASTKQGFLPLSIANLACADICYDDSCIHGLFDEENCQRQVKTLGEKNRILVLRNHGVIVCGSTVEETFFTVGCLVMAAKTQLIASTCAKDLENLMLVSLADVTTKREKMLEIYSSINVKATDGIVWKIGEIEYEAEMRRLDAMGCKTSYEYKSENL